MIGLEGINSAFIIKRATGKELQYVIDCISHFHSPVQFKENACGAKSYDESAKKGNRQDIASVPTLLSKTILSAEDAHFDPIGKQTSQMFHSVVDERSTLAISLRAGVLYG